MKSTIFWDITPCSPLSVNRRFGGTYSLQLQGRKNKLRKKPAWKQMASTFYSPPDFCSGYFSTLKMEAIFSSETSVDTQRTYTALYPRRWYSYQYLVYITSIDEWWIGKNPEGSACGLIEVPSLHLRAGTEIHKKSQWRCPDVTIEIRKERLPHAGPDFYRYTN
jgi:hypothetical protein